MGIWPLKHLQNWRKHTFLQNRHKEDLQMGVLKLQISSFDRIWPKSKSSLWQFWRKVYFLQFWRCFRGQIPIFWWVIPTFLSSEQILQLIYHNSWKKSGPFRQKNGHLTPKSVFRGPILLQQRFWGQMPIFSSVIATFFSLNQFFHWFIRISEKMDPLVEKKWEFYPKLVVFENKNFF